MSNCICIPYLSITVSIVLCLPLHVHNCVENVIKYVLFYMYDIKVMVEKIDLSIKKLLENILFYLIVGQTKIRKLLLTGLKTKHNIIVLRHHVIQFFTWKKWRCNISFNYANKEVIFVLSKLMICWEELSVIV